MKNKILLSTIALITFFSSTAQQWEHIGNAGFTTSGTDYNGMAIGSDESIYVLANVTNASTEVWTFNDSTWELVGPSDFSGFTSVHQSICISENDSLYVGMSEWTEGEKASVMKYNGTDWVYVGSPGISAAKADFTNVRTINDSVYISFNDYDVNQKLSVMKYNGTSWSYVGSQGFSDGEANRPNMEIYNGTPYVAFADISVSGKMSVMRYDGFNWEYIGNQGFTPDEAGYNDLAIDANGTPYVSFADWSVGGKASVMKFDGTNWVYAGTAGLTSVGVNYTKLDFDELDRPYIAYNKTDGSNELIVQLFDFASWSSIGGAVTDDCQGRVDFKVINYGKYYISFNEGLTGSKTSVKVLDLSSNIEELSYSNTFGVFPNPANDIITIDNNGEAFESVTILSLSGQVILSTGLDNTIDISELPNGVYIIKLLTKEGTKHSRFVKG